MEQGPSPGTASHDEQGEEVKKWPVGERIGQGAFGDAFLIMDPKAKKKYVLKRIRMARQNEWQRSATRQEIKLGAMLQHPFIVRFVKSWIRDGHEVNLVYDFCSQGDLQTLLKKQKGKHIDEQQLRRWLAELLLALHYLQSKQVLHRDLKSSNIFLTGDNDVQIGDFGLATIRDVQDSSHHDQSIVGTPHFMSPEVLNRKKYDFKTDIWSLGCVIYELSALRSPFNAFNLNGLVSKICKSAVAPLPSQYSDEWSSVIKWMLKKSATKRPSVEELLASEALRSDVLWARERAVQISPGIDLPPLPAPAPLLRQLSTFSACAAGAGEDDVLCGGDDGLHTPVREQLLQPDDVLSGSKDGRLSRDGHSGRVSVDESTQVTQGELKACSHHSGSSGPISGKEILGIMDAPVVAVLPAAAAGRADARSAAPAPKHQDREPPGANPAPTKAAAAGGQDRKPVVSGRLGEPINVSVLDAAKAARAEPAAGGVKRTRRASALVTATGTAAAAPLKVAKGVATAAAFVTAVHAPAAKAGAVAGGAEAESGTAAQQRAARLIPAAACQRADGSKPVAAAAAKLRSTRSSRQLGQAAKPAEESAALHSGQAASMGLDAQAELPSKQLYNSLMTQPAHESGMQEALPGAVEKDAPADRAKSMQRPWHAATQQTRTEAVAGTAVAERRGQAHVVAGQQAAGVAVPRYRDAAKAVAAAAVAAAAAAAAALLPAGAGPAAADPGLQHSTAAAVHGPDSSQAVVGTRLTRRLGSKGSPARRTSRSASGVGRAGVPTDGDGSAAVTTAASRKVHPLPVQAAPAETKAVGHAVRGARVAPVAVASVKGSDAASLGALAATTGKAAGALSSNSTEHGSLAAAVAVAPTAALPDKPTPASDCAGVEDVPSPQQRRSSYISASGHQLCEEFSLLSLPPRDLVARSSSCSSLPSSNAPSTRSRRSRPSSVAGLSPSISPVCRAPQSRLACRSTGGLEFSADAEAVASDSEEAGSKQRSSGADAMATPAASADLSPVVSAPMVGYAGAAASVQQPQLFDNQLFQSPNSRKAGCSAAGSGRKDGDVGSQSPGCSVSSEVMGPAAARAGCGQDAKAKVPEAWVTTSDTLGCPISFADLAAGSATAADSSGSSRGGTGHRDVASELHAPEADATATIQTCTAASSGLPFAGFKTAGAAMAAGGASLAAPVDTTPAFPARMAAFAGEHNSSLTDAMSVSTASNTDLMSVTRRLDMYSADDGTGSSHMTAPGSLGKWVGPGAASEEARSVAPSKRSGGHGVDAASPAPVKSGHLGMDSATAGSTAGQQSAEQSRLKERLATLERVVALASRLHSMGRWHELGSVLSSTQSLSPSSSAVASPITTTGTGLQPAAGLPTGPWITSPGGGARALNVGDKVIVGSRRGIATIRYFGPTHWAPGDYVGLELDRPEGKHHGEVDGITYFRCQPMHGIFVKSSMLKPAAT